MNQLKIGTFLIVLNNCKLHNLVISWKNSKFLFAINVTFK